MDRNVWRIATGLVLVGLAAATASAQGYRQEGHVEMEGALTATPDELPGVYEAQVEAVTSVQGGVCGCTQTTVDLAVADPGLADTVVLSPSSWTIDWTRQAAYGQQAHDKDLRVTVEVVDAPAGERLTRVEIGGQASTDSPGTRVEVNSLELAIPLAEDGNASRAGQPANASDGGPSGDAEGIRTASAGITGGGVGLDGVAIGTGAATAGLALAGLAVRRVEV